MTFRGPRDGRQYVVIAAGGDGEVLGSADAIVAFRLKALDHRTVPNLRSLSGCLNEVGPIGHRPTSRTLV